MLGLTKKNNYLRASIFEAPPKPLTLKDNMIILGADLNFTLNAREVWGTKASLDSQADFFQNQFEKA